MSLKKYRQMRNFKVTAEPYGKTQKKRQELLYLIQKHAASHLHYDFRLELGGTLKSWAVPKGPSLDPSIKRLAVHVEDHPIEYGSFEGIIPKGQYGGGTVMLWDRGEWICEDKDPFAAYTKGALTIQLKGKKLKGLWKLVKIKSDPKNWLLMKISDKYATDKFDITEKKPNSVISRRSLAGIAGQKEPGKKISNPFSLILKKTTNNPLPQTIYPELATLVDQAPKGNEWLHEVKFDGYRLLCFIRNKKISFITRNQHDWTHFFPFLVKQIKQLKIKNAIFDGELVALNDKKMSDFQLLQNSIHEEETSGLVYYIFDLLYYQNKNLMSIALIERKKILAELLTNAPEAIVYSDHIIGKGDKFFKKSCQLGLEGIVSKKVHSHYSEKRTRDWLKVKCIKRQEFVIIGFTPPQGKRKHFGSLLLAVNNNQHQLQYCGNVGTGFTEDSLTMLGTLLKKNTTDKSPLTSVPKGLGRLTWVKPKLIAEVEFTEWTKDGALRHPSFKGLRDDKKPTEIKREIPE